MADPLANLSQVWPIRTTLDRIRAYRVVALNYLSIRRASDDYGLYAWQARVLGSILDYAAGVPCPWTLPDDVFHYLKPMRRHVPGVEFSRWSLPAETPPHTEPQPRKRRARAKTTPADIAPATGGHGQRDTPLLVQASPRTVKA
jgi:hypothetical protein